MAINSTKKVFAYYVTNLDWGDGSDLEYTDSPKQFDRIDNFQHTYTMPGFYSIKGSDDFAIERAINFGEYSDSVWIETSTPSLSQAALHSKSIHKQTLRGLHFQSFPKDLLFYTKTLNPLYYPRPLVLYRGFLLP